jgi:hypothetical protein
MIKGEWQVSVLFNRAIPAGNGYGIGVVTVVGHIDDVGDGDSIMDMDILIATTISSLTNSGDDVVEID